MNKDFMVSGCLIIYNSPTWFWLLSIFLLVLVVNNIERQLIIAETEFGMKSRTAGNSIGLRMEGQKASPYTRGHDLNSFPLAVDG